ncbi:hypothetical protein niasHT_024020 [Heterodera trifolii]|uniref:Diacylglycerol kinase n=1 Tax=Heterodera trifolii TaxID=157864 RepID=A0ABD2KPE1_9BILA
MLQSLARFSRKGAERSNSTKERPKKCGAMEKKCTTTADISLLASSSLGTVSGGETAALPPKASGTTPKCSNKTPKVDEKQQTAHGTAAAAEENANANGGRNAKKGGQKPTKGGAKSNANSRRCQRQSSIIEDVVMDDFDEITDQFGPSTSSPMHSRTATPNLGFEPNGFRPDSALCSSAHSSATSPVDSNSTNSRRSFHVRLPDAMANLRKSGAHLVRNLRRSSIAAVMRAIGTTTPSPVNHSDDQNNGQHHEDNASFSGDSRQPTGLVGGGNPSFYGSAIEFGGRHNNDCSAGAMPLRCRTLTGACHSRRAMRFESVPASTDESRRSTMACNSTTDGTEQQCQKRSGWHGSAARRAMRKRISAARLAMRKISRVSTHSAGTVASRASTSSTHSSPKTPLSVHGYCGGNTPDWMWANSTEHPLKNYQKNNNQKMLKTDNENNDNGNGLGETEQKQQQMNREGKGQTEEEDEDGQKEEQKKGGKRAKGNWEDKKEGKKEEENNKNSNSRRRNSSKRTRKRSKTTPTAEGGGGGKAAQNEWDKRRLLGPSLSWDPQQCEQQQCKLSRPRSPLFTTDGTDGTQCATAADLRGRIHSDGSAERLAHTNKRLSIFLTAKIMPTKGGHAEKKPKGKRRKKSGGLPKGTGAAEKIGLELNCLHCVLQAEYHASTLRTEIECAVKQLAIRLNSSDSGKKCVDSGDGMALPATARRRAFTATTVRVEVETERRHHQQEHDQHQQLRRNIGTPDIVISSYNSAEETPPTESADEGFWTTSSATGGKGTAEKPPRHPPQQKRREDNGTGGGCGKFGRPLSSIEFDKKHSSMDINFSTVNTNVHCASVSGAVVWSPMDTLKPPGGPPFGGGGGGSTSGPNSLLLYCSNSSSSSASVAPSPARSLVGTAMPLEFAISAAAIIGSGGNLNAPPRSNSVDLSLLRRDIERWSVGTGAGGSNLSMAESTTDLEMVELRNGKTGVSTPGGDSTRTIRSRSYDPSSSPDFILRRPSRIEHLSEIFRRALAKSPVVKRAAAIQEQEQKRVSKHRTSRYWLDEQLSPSEHIWLPSSASSASSSAVDTECYLGEKDCQKMGEKRRCSGCHIVAHTACFSLLAKMNLSCKMTFRDCAQSANAKSPSSMANRKQRHSKSEQNNGNELLNNNSTTITTTTCSNNNKHHWVHRWRLEGRCSHCGKSFQQKMFREKEVIAITCSWCKRSYHNKRHCFSLARFDDRCDRGVLRELILPPGWLLRLAAPRRRSANPATGSRMLAYADAAAQKRSRRRSKYRAFVVKPPPPSRCSSSQAHGVANAYSRWATAAQLQPLPIQPLLVFVNPKSGGNKGAKALNTLCWLLNPRQVFDVNVMRGPKYGLDMFRKIHSSMRILVCGGDGTVGWVLSTLDQLGWPAYPPIALLPLGTGNDLSRAMGWGGTFSSDEPLAEVLAAIQTETSITHLDRWCIDVCPLAAATTAAGANNGTTEQQQTTTTAFGTSGNKSDDNCSNGSDVKMEQHQQQQQTNGGATTTNATGASLTPNLPLLSPPTVDGGGVLQAVQPAQTVAAASVSSADEAAAVGANGEAADAVQNQLPLSVMNNYFSIGADAHVALQFHQSRSANPQMLNSRFKNRIAYGGLGTIDLFKRTWKDLSEYINVECDGVDITSKIREFKFHCILFHNISFYAGGTVPWGAGDGVQENCGEVFSRPSPCDGKIEVLGFTTATLAALQMGGKGERIAQCSKVRIETSKPIPMQVDGEPCLLGPSLIHLSFHNKVPMLRREKFARPPGSVPCNNIVSMGQNRRKSSQNSSANSSVAGGVVGGCGTATTVPTTAIANGTVLTGHCANFRASVSPEGPLFAAAFASSCAAVGGMGAAASPPSSTMLLDVPVVVVGRHDYDTYRDSVERLKDTGFELGLLNVEAETELVQLRPHIQQMMCEHQILPYDPGPDWRFLDYVSNAEEGTFRVSRHQEQSRTVADVCTLEAEEGTSSRAGIFILDDAFPSMSARAAAIGGHELVFTPAKMSVVPTVADRRTMIRRRISETLRIVLANDAPETHL